MQGYVLDNLVLDSRMLSLILPQDQGYGFLLGSDAEKNLSLISNGKLCQLAALSERLPAEREEIIRLGTDLCRALIQLEQHDAVHGKISPACIYVKEDGSYVLAGSAGADAAPSASEQSYSAPEAPWPSIQHDIYAVGVILLSLARDLLPVSSYSRLREIAQRACADEPNSRYFSPTQLMQDLLAIARVPASPSVASGAVPSLLVKSSGVRVPISSESFRIGRGSSCDLRFNEKPRHKRISRQHLLIFLEDGTWYLEDTDSKNGTKLNGITVFAHAVYPLHDNDVITLANAEEIVFRE